MNTIITIIELSMVDVAHMITGVLPDGVGSQWQQKCNQACGQKGKCVREGGLTNLMQGAHLILVILVWYANRSAVRAPLCGMPGQSNMASVTWIVQHLENKAVTDD